MTKAFVLAEMTEVTSPPDNYPCPEVSPHARQRNRNISHLVLRFYQRFALLVTFACFHRFSLCLGSTKVFRKKSNRTTEVCLSERFSVDAVSQFNSLLAGWKVLTTGESPPFRLLHRVRLALVSQKLKLGWRNLAVLVDHR